MSDDYPHIPDDTDAWTGYQVAADTSQALAQLDQDQWTLGFEAEATEVWTPLRHICNQLMDGRSIYAILAEDRKDAHGNPRVMPPRHVIIAWLERAEQLRGTVGADNPYIRLAAMEKVARKGQVAALIDDCLVIADDVTGDHKVVFDGNGNARRVFDREAVQRSNLRIKTRFTLAKLAFARWDAAFDDEVQPGQAQKVSDVEDIVKAAEARTSGLPASIIEAKKV